MKVVILTSKPYWEFVNDIADQYSSGNGFWISEALAIPNEYNVGISFMHLNKVPAKHVNSHTWINFHPAPLPEYKGRDLCYHAIMNGEKEFGATVHYMDEHFDTGDIIMVRKFKLYDHWTAEDIYNLVIEYSKELFVYYLPRILAGEKFERHPNVGGTYYKKGGIVDEMPLHDVPLSRWIRAVTYKDFHPTITIGGTKYKIVREK